MCQAIRVRYASRTTRLAYSLWMKQVLKSEKARFRNYASIKKPDEDDDYVIDLITLKKRYKGGNGRGFGADMKSGFAGASKDVKSEDRGAASSPASPASPPRQESAPAAPPASPPSPPPPSKSAEPESPASNAPEPQDMESFEKEFQAELLLLKTFFGGSPTLQNVIGDSSRLNDKVIESVLAKFKTSFFRDYLNNQAKCDVTKIYQMCNQLQRDESLFKKLFSKDATTKPKLSDPQIDDILKVFNKPLEKRKKKDKAEDSSTTIKYNTASKPAELVEDSAAALEKEIKTRAINAQDKDSGDIQFLKKFARQVTRESKNTNRKEVEDSTLQQLTASDIRNKYSKLYTTQRSVKNTSATEGQEPKAQESHADTATDAKKGFDTHLESIESFLKNAKEANELSKEETFRRQKAYEWSKSQLDGNLIEDGKFFQPKMIPGTLIPFSALNPFDRSSNDLLFPSFSKKQTKEFLLLTASGKTINCGTENPLGFNYIPRDLFTILSTMDRPEIFIKPIKKLTKKNWKLIGGNDDKILIFARVAKKRYLWRILKNFFAFVGMVSTGLIAGSFFLDDKDIQLRNAKRVITDHYGAEGTIFSESE